VIGRRDWHPLGCLAVLACAGTACGTAPRARRYEVDVRDLSFTPDSLVVAKGDTVQWANHDIVPHTVTADAEWDSGAVPNGGTFTWVAAHAGMFRYRCAYHPTRVASVTVR
jgi:plastocyanin